MFNYTKNIFKWLKPLGNMSYGIYLFHVCIMRIFDFYFLKFHLNNTKIEYFIAYYITLILISFGISKLINKLIEKPFVDHLDYIINQRKA